MANVEHSALTGSNLHEPKGCAAAAASTVYVADGAGSGSFTTLSNASLASAAKAFQAQLLHVQDQKASGTAGGTFTSGAWRTRTLNTVLTNEITSAALASNQITLPAGTYFIQASAPACISSFHKAKLRNITDGSDTLIGTSEHSFSNVQVITRALVNGRFTIAGTKVFELQHQTGNTEASNGLGIQTTFGVVEIYAEVMIWKVA